MITLEQIDKELFQSDTVKPDKNFVAAAVMVLPNGYAQHSGFVISYNNDYYLFHYTGEKVELEGIPTGQWYFHKKLDFITEDEVLAFYAHCRIIKDKANPKYGFFYAGDYYNKEGKYFSESGIQEYMTCVGFCINVVTGFFENNTYFTYNDWDDTGLKRPNEYFEDFLKKAKEENPDVKIDETLYRRHIRRISPLEYTTSAYLETLPITKSEVDKSKGNVQTILIKRVTPTPNPINN